jgi:hypothetical protein
VSMLVSGVNGDESSLESRLRADALSSIRWRLLVGALVIGHWATRWAPVYQSMNVEMDLLTRGILATCNIFQEWWIILMPLVLVNYRLFETRLLRRVPLTGLTFVGRLAAVGIVLTLLQMQNILAKLINNVG